MDAVIICSGFVAQKNKDSHCLHCFPIYLSWSNGTRCHDLSFLNVEFKPVFSLSSHLHQETSSSLLSAIREVLSVYVKLLISWQSIPAYASPSLAFHMMCSACTLNKQGDNIQPWRTPFPIWNQSIVPCLVLTVAPWPAYRFPRR